MKRSIMCVGWTLGSAALFALGMGCSHQEHPAQTPTTAGTTTPPFESNVPPGPAGQAQQPGAPPEPGAPPGPGAEAPPMPAPLPPGAPPMGAPEQPGAMGPGAMGPGAMGPGAMPSGPSERQICETLASAAKIHVEDVKNGVAIVLVPKAGHNIAQVHEQAQQLQGAMRRPPMEAQAGGEMCGIVSLGRLPSVSTQTTQGVNAVRIVVTTSNPPEVRDLRRAARDQVNNLIKQAPGGR